MAEILIGRKTQVSRCWRMRHGFNPTRDSCSRTWRPRIWHGRDRRDRPAICRVAQAAAERAIRLDPSLPEAHFNRALALDAQDQIESAAGAWTAFLQLDSTSPWAREARERLDLLEKRKSAGGRR